MLSHTDARSGDDGHAAEPIQKPRTMRKCAGLHYQPLFCWLHPSNFAPIFHQFLDDLADAIEAVGCVAVFRVGFRAGGDGEFGGRGV